MIPEDSPAPLVRFSPFWPNGIGIQYRPFEARKSGTVGMPTRHVAPQLSLSEMVPSTYGKVVSADAGLWLIGTSHRRGILAPDGCELLQPKNRSGILAADLTATRLRLRNHRGELPLHNDRKSLNASVNA